LKIFITGSSGFIGSALIKRLIKEKNFKILNLSRSKKIQTRNIKFIVGDLGKINLLKKKIKRFNPDVLIHLAWEGIPDFSKKMSRRNYLNSVNLIKFLTNYTKISKIIISGSCFEKVRSGKYNLPFSKYKIQLKEKVKHLCKRKKLSFIWLRFFYVYGINQKASSLIPFILNSLKKESKINIQKPYYKHDFIYIDDVIDSILKSIYLKDYISDDLDIGSGKATIINYIVKKIAFYQNKKIIINSDSKEKNLMHVANIRKSLKILKWKPNISINKGIKKIIQI
tara:strand:+ start:288 stop:1133 length:846 start_codon:yes stop_codon:yes gene_type:complete